VVTHSTWELLVDRAIEGFQPMLPAALHPGIVTNFGEDELLISPGIILEKTKIVIKQVVSSAKTIERRYKDLIASS
jgi:hypothetical protein